MNTANKKSPLVFAIIALASLSFGTLSVSAEPTKAESKAVQTGISKEAFELHKQAFKAANKDDFTAAIGFLQRAVELEPKFSDALYNLGSLYLHQAQYQDAYFYFQRLVTIDHKDNQARLQKAICLIGLKNFPEAGLELAKIPNETEDYLRVNEILEFALSKQLDRLKDSPIPTLYPGKSSTLKAYRQIESPTGITSDGESIYIADFFSNSIRRSAPNAAEENGSELFLESPLLSGPSSLAFDPVSNALIVANYRSGSLLSVNLNSKEVTVIATELKKPYAIYLGARNKLYVSEQGKRTVSVLDWTGSAK